MKKIFLTLVAATSLAFAAKAQVSIIPKAGITFANITFPDKEDGQKATTGLLFGAGFNFPLDSDGFLSIQPELLYIQKGVAAESGGTTAGIHRNYLELPVLAKISFGGETVKGYVNAGPSVGYTLSQKLFSGSNSAKLDFDDSMNRTDFSLQFGGGLGFQAGPGSVLLDLRYGYGLNNFTKTPSGGNRSDYKSQNRVIAVSVGYAIPLGGN